MVVWPLSVTRDVCSSVGSELEELIPGKNRCKN
jgi:hypothetical protein